MVTEVVHMQVTTGKSGERQGSGTAVQLPDAPCTMVNIKARSDNAGSVYLGWSSAVTVADGTTDTTTGFELDAGQETGWIPVPNVNCLWMICDNDGDDITYITLAHRLTGA